MGPIVMPFDSSERAAQCGEILEEIEALPDNGAKERLRHLTLRMAHEAAIEKAKRDFGGQCVFTGLAGLDGMHLYPAGKYKEYADDPLNIYPGVRYWHSVDGKACFDKRANGYERPVGERIWMLRNMSRDEVRSKVRARVDEFLEKIGALTPETEDVDYGRPIDEKVLRGRKGDWWSSALAEVGDEANGDVSSGFRGQDDHGDDQRLVVAPFG